MILHRADHPLAKCSHDTRYDLGLSYVIEITFFCSHDADIAIVSVLCVRWLSAFFILLESGIRA